MLRSLSTLQGLTVSASLRWAVRYFVVDTGTWLSGRRVLTSPMSLRTTDVVEDRLDMGISKAQVEQSPSWDTDKPVSRQQEIVHEEVYAA